MHTEFHLGVSVKQLTSGVADDRESVDVSAHGSVVTTQAKFIALALVSNFFTSVLLSSFYCAPLSLLFLIFFSHFFLLTLC
jgi:hypothetical protein